MTIELDALVKLATEYWRLLKLAERAANDMQSPKMASVVAQIRYSTSRLQAICQEGGLRLLAYNREPYEPNLPVTVSNAEEAAEFGDAIVVRTLEPTIIADGQVVAMGKVLLKRRV
jgi:hypothetical protein